jgi:arginyl-tRNA synthetase
LPNAPGAGDKETRHIWRQLIDVSLAGFNAAYQRMGVLLTDDDLAGESIYNDDLPSIVTELEQNGIAVIDDGALCVFVEGFAAPMIVQKSDGGFGYSATDLAAIRYRVRDLHADRIIYVVDARQSDHFDLVFAVARKAGFLPDSAITEHVAFGTVLGTDGKPFKTREGTAPTLTTLLDAAEEQAAPPVALAAIKYADLSNALNKDYVFDVGRMVQTTGNTGPYLQYAHARVTQVLRKATSRGYGEQSKVLVLEEPAEQTLALLLTRFGDVVEDVGRTLQPHRLCNYRSVGDLLRAVSGTAVLRCRTRLAAGAVLGHQARTRFWSHHARNRAFGSYVASLDTWTLRALTPLPLTR